MLQNELFRSPINRRRDVTKLTISIMYSLNPNVGAALQQTAEIPEQRYYFLSRNDVLI